MKKIFFLSALAMLIAVSAESQLLKKLGDKVKSKANQRIDQKTDQAIDKSMDTVEDSLKNAGKTDGNTTSTSSTATNSSSTNSGNNTTSSTSSTPAAGATFKTYQNYDFIPGEKILFEDHFTDDQNGEFAAHWELQNGQAVVNQFNGKPALLITDGNYGWSDGRLGNFTFARHP